MAPADAAGYRLPSATFKVRLYCLPAAARRKLRNIMPTFKSLKARRVPLRRETGSRNPLSEIEAAADRQLRNELAALLKAATRGDSQQDIDCRLIQLFRTEMQARQTRLNLLLNTTACMAGRSRQNTRVH